MYLHIQRLINEIEADEPDTAVAAALQEGLGGPAPAPGRRRSTPPPAFKQRAGQLTAPGHATGAGPCADSPPWPCRTSWWGCVSLR